MFIAKRHKRAIESFALADADGNVVKTFEVRCDPEECLVEYNRARNNIIRAEQLLNSAPSAEGYAAYGQAVLDILAIFFGEERTKEILAFFDDRYAEMVSEVMPFIVDVLEPRMREISKQQLAQVKKRHQK